MKCGGNVVKKMSRSGIIIILLCIPISSQIYADISFSVTMEGGCGSTFCIGDEMLFTISIDTSAYITINVATPESEQEIVRNLFKSRGEHDFTYTVVGPVGRHALVSKARDKYGKIIEDRCEFKVIDRRDSDNDGVSDSKDRCPRSACTSVDATGCPLDSDGDGVNDCEDQCSNSSCGRVDATGCPLDSDGDGVNDCEDQCPEEAGIPSENGCPETLPPEPPSTPPSSTSSVIHSGISSSLLYLAIPILLLIIGLLVYRMKKKDGKSKQSAKYSKKEQKKLREELDEDYIEDRISRKEYLKKKEELGDE
jgi:hypothetical protein